MCFAPQRRAIFADRNFKNGSEHDMFCTFWVENVLGATAACNFSTSNLQKVVRTHQFFNILTCKCASRHSGVPFLQIATSKMAPSMRCFVHFDLQMCFAPQRRAIFLDRNFKNGSAPEVLCTFWLTNVLRATAACEFSRSQLQKWLRQWGVLYILTYKCASRHSGVPFFISRLSSSLRTRRFNEPTFRTSGSTNHWENTAIRDFTNISRTCIFWDLTAVVLWFSMTLMLCYSLFLWLEYCSTLLFYSAFQLSILSEVRPLNFLRWCVLTSSFSLLTTYREEAVVIQVHESAEDSAHPKNLRDAPVDAEAESQRADCPPEC